MTNPTALFYRRGRFVCLIALAAIFVIATTALPAWSQSKNRSTQRNNNQRNDAQQKRSDASPTSDDLKRALSFRPLQPDVDYDKPSDEEIKDCRLVSAETIGKKGYLIFDGSGRLLRAYLDVNKKDDKPDQWSYYKDGVEVYRDVDSDGDEKADQYRWMGTAGIRWAEDQNQDGKIDRWKMISAEEVSMEIVESIRQNDPRRFNLLLISNNEISSLGLGKELEDEITERSANAKSKFSEFVRSQKLISSNSSWVHFGGTRPGFIPAGTNGSSKDVMIYDSVQAVVNSGNQHGQLAIGTLVRVDEAWRLVDLPEVIKEGMVISNGGTFFNASATSETTGANTSEGNVDDGSQKLYAKYIEMEEQLEKAKGRELSNLHLDRAKILIEMAGLTKSEQNKSNWIRQMADDVSGAYQNDEFSNGYEFLQQFGKNLTREKADPMDVAYVSYRSLAAFYTKKLTTAKQGEYADIEKEQVAALGDFIAEYPKAMHVPDAMLQLALSAEFKDEIKEASEWYGKIADQFPSSPIARKAAGAKIRLTSEGKTIPFGGKTIRGENWKLSDESGKVVLIHFWATWCEPCKQDIEVIKRMYSKYEDDGLVVIGASVDDDPDTLKAFLRDERLPWTQLFEEGGQEGPLAEQLGIATWPTMLLIGKDGKVVNRNITSSELERAIQRATRD